MTSSAVMIAALTASAVVHAAILLGPMGHGRASTGTADVSVVTEVTLEASAPVEVADVAKIAVARSASVPTHTHPYPVPLDHDAVPHAPDLDHRILLARSVAPAQAPRSEIAPVQDDTPSFTIAIGGTTTAAGVVSAEGRSARSDGAKNSPIPESGVDGKARLVRGVSPAYPSSARAGGIEGDVSLEIDIGESGEVESARVVRGVSPALDEAARKAVREFRFTPASKAGHPVRVRMDWSVQFRLD